MFRIGLSVLVVAALVVTLHAAPEAAAATGAVTVKTLNFFIHVSKLAFSCRNQGIAGFNPSRRCFSENKPASRRPNSNRLTIG